MIELHGMSTPNVYKVTIMLEETGLPYRVRHVDVFAGQQYEPDFLRISPNNKVPAIVDLDGPEGKPQSVFESVAILQYLAEKTGKLLPSSGADRVVTLQWLMFQCSSIGPMFGQCVHFTNFGKEGGDYSVQRYSSEAKRLFNVMETRLTAASWFNGRDYSVADIAIFPWIRTARTIFPWLLEGKDTVDDPFHKYPHLAAWFEKIAVRPAVERGIRACDKLQEADIAAFSKADQDAFDRFFGRGKFVHK